MAREERALARGGARASCSFLGLEARAEQLASALPYGELRLLEVAIALAAKPKLLLLDEPVSGMNPSETVELHEDARRASAALGITVLLVEHDMKMVMGVSDRVICLNQGRIIASGAPAEIQRDPEVIQRLPGREVRPCSRLRASPAATAKWQPCASCRSRSTRASSSRLIGANGAGKTTTLKAISGVLPPAQRPHHLPRRGHHARRARRILQARHRPLPRGPARVSLHERAENLEMGCYLRSDADGIASDMERLFERFPILAERRHQAAGTLSGGEQQMLAISRALMSGPSSCCSTSPRWAWPPTWSSAPSTSSGRSAAEGVTVVMVEQNAFAALELSDRAYVLEQGRVTLTGPGAELLDNPHVKAPIWGSDHGPALRPARRPPALVSGGPPRTGTRCGAHRAAAFFFQSPANRSLSRTLMRSFSTCTWTVCFGSGGPTSITTFFPSTDLMV